MLVDPAFAPSMAHALREPMGGFACKPLGRAFCRLESELDTQDELLPLFTEGWTMQALAYVAQASRLGASGRAKRIGGMSAWQLHRAQEMMRANLAEGLSLRNLAQACAISIGHFSRTFKASTGLPPRRWLLRARVVMACDLLQNSTSSLAEVDYTCGFADQSHFSRVFARFTGTSPSVWRCTQRA